VKLAEGIRKHGFCTWYERLLLASHGWLVLAIIFALVAFGALETLVQSSQFLAQAKSAFVILASGAAAIVTLHRFLSQLARAQKISSQAGCSECGRFGRFRVLAEDRAGTWVRVRCRDCGSEWAMDDVEG
jgi:hypothetical protein